VRRLILLALILTACDADRPRRTPCDDLPSCAALFPLSLAGWTLETGREIEGGPECMVVILPEERQARVFPCPGADGRGGQLKRIVIVNR